MINIINIYFHIYMVFCFFEKSIFMKPKNQNNHSQGRVNTGARLLVYPILIMIFITLNILIVNIHQNLESNLFQKGIIGIWIVIMVIFFKKTKCITLKQKTDGTNSAQI